MLLSFKVWKYRIDIDLGYNKEPIEFWFSFDLSSFWFNIALLWIGFYLQIDWYNTTANKELVEEINNERDRLLLLDNRSLKFIRDLKEEMPHEGELLDHIYFCIVHQSVDRQLNKKVDYDINDKESVS